MGHRRIAYITGSAPLFELTQREQGFRDAMAAAGVPVDERLIADGHFRPRIARQLTAAFLSEDSLPTAILCATDEMALGVLAELNARGIRVPDDMSVTGYDNTRYAELTHPPLTTIAQPAHEIGTRAMQALLRQIAGKPVSRASEYVDYQLILRRSVGRVREA
nr:substrate-binding domain-containing protein [Poseidonocella sp. HB161398]